MFAVTIVYGPTTADFHTFETMQEVNDFIDNHKRNRIGGYTSRPEERYVISEVIEDKTFAFSRSSTQENYKISY